MAHLEADRGLHLLVGARVRGPHAVKEALSLPVLEGRGPLEVEGGAADRLGREVDFVGLPLGPLQLNSLASLAVRLDVHLLGLVCDEAVRVDKLLERFGPILAHLRRRQVEFEPHGLSVQESRRGALASRLLCEALRSQRKDGAVVVIRVKVHAFRVHLGDEPSRLVVDEGRAGPAARLEMETVSGLLSSAIRDGRGADKEKGERDAHARSAPLQACSRT